MPDLNPAQLAALLALAGFVAYVALYLAHEAACRAVERHVRRGLGEEEV